MLRGDKSTNKTPELRSAAQAIARQLQNQDYHWLEWLKQNKYKLEHRPLLRLVCAIMLNQTCPAFWEALLERQADITGYAHLQLMMYSLEVVHCHHIPNVQIHLATIQNAIIKSLSTTSFDTENGLLTAIKACPTVMTKVWPAIATSITHMLRAHEVDTSAIKSICDVISALQIPFEQLPNFLRYQLFYHVLALAEKNVQLNGFYPLQIAQSFIAQVASLTRAERHSLLHDLFTKAETGNAREKYVALCVLEHYTPYMTALTSGERYQLLTIARTEKNSKIINDYAAHISEFPLAEKSAFLTNLLAKLANPDNKYEVVMILQSCATQAGQLSKEERGKIFTALLILAKDKNLDVRENACTALQSYATQARRFPTVERQQTLTALLTLAKEYYPGIKKNPWSIPPAWIHQATDLLAKEHHPMLILLFLLAKNQKSPAKKHAWETLQSSIVQAGQFLATENDPVFTKLLEFANHRYPETRAGVCETLQACIKQAASLAEKTRTQVFATLLHLMEDDDADVRKSAREALQTYITQIRLFPEEERHQILAAFFRLVKNENAALRKEACQLASMIQAEHFLVEELAHEQDPILTELIRLAQDPKTEVRIRAGEALHFCMTQVGQLSAEERAQAVTALLHLATDSDTHIRKCTSKTLHACVTQIENFSVAERSKILAALLDFMKHNSSILCQHAWDALQVCAVQATSFTEQECSAVREIFFGLAKRESKELSARIKENVYQAIESYATQAPRLPANERKKLLAILLQATTSPSVDKKQHAIATLKRYIETAPQLPADENIALLTQLIDSTDETVRHLAVTLLNKASWSSHMLLQLSYEKMYPLLKQALKEKECLRATPLAQLFDLYIFDGTTGLLGFHPRRDLWLQCIVARTLQEGCAIRIVDNTQLELDSPSGDYVIKATEPKQQRLLTDLRTAFSEQAAKLDLVTSEAQSKEKFTGRHQPMHKLSLFKQLQDEQELLEEKEAIQQSNLVYG